MKFYFPSYFSFVLLFLLRTVSYAASGTEGAAFLDIPVGARPAAMGSSYSALATDGYAPTYNPAGLGFLTTNEVTAMHLAYLESISYEYASFVHPLSESDGIGGAIQFLLPGTIDGTDVNGNSIGTINGHYGAYAFSYAHTFQKRWALGVTGKIIQAAIADASATTYAADVGGLYQINHQLTLAATASNMGAPLTLVSQSDQLPTALHLGVAYTPPASHWILTGELEYERMGLFNIHTGMEWTPVSMLSLRCGYKTDTIKNLNPLAGFSAGFGLHVWGQELDYAWVPLGDLGNTQYVSLVIRFGNPVSDAMLKKKQGDAWNNESEPDFKGIFENDESDYQLLNPQPTQPAHKNRGGNQ